MTHRNQHNTPGNSRSSTGQSSTKKRSKEPSLRSGTAVTSNRELTDSPIHSRNQSFSTMPGQVSTAPSTMASSSAGGSQVDLTKPIIGSTAAGLANNESIDVDDVESEASSDSESSGANSDDVPYSGIVTVNGHEPHFSTGRYIVAERVSTHGHIRPFEQVSEVPALDPALREHIGQVHGEGAIQKWLAKRAEWDDRYRSHLDKWRKIRLEDRQRAEKEGYLTRDLQRDRPPLCSLAGWYDRDLARAAGKSVDEISGKTSAPMLLWSKISQKVSEELSGTPPNLECREERELTCSRTKIERGERTWRRSRRIWRMSWQTSILAGRRLCRYRMGRSGHDARVYNAQTMGW